MTPGSTIDGCAFHDWGASPTLVPYMPAGWGDLITRSGDLLGPMNIKADWLHDHPLGGRAPETAPETGPPGSDPDLLLRQALDARGVERAVLGYHDGLLSSGYPAPYTAREAVRAANDWTVDRWLSRDERLYAHLLVVSSQPDEAAAEIRRLGSNERFVAVALGANGLGRPFGHPVYHPIYAAAAELGLPLVLQAGCDSMADVPGAPTAVGLPSTFAESRVLSAQSLMAHVISMIMAGVFDLYQDLRVLLVGGGVAWVPSLLWRLDFNVKFTRRLEAPWMRMTSTEYFTRHIRLGTYSLEAPAKPERLAKVLRTIPGVESMLLYTSGYPNDDGEPPEAIAARLPQEWHEQIFRENALAFYRWPGETPARREPAAAHGQFRDLEATGIGD
jgi:predicted TIM-barrel fold metal-dependent hydrolase